MSAEKIHINDIGTSVRIQVQEDGVDVDISAATTLQIKLKKPSGILDTHIASFVTDGTDALMHYITASGDLDEAGTWRIQGFIIFPSSSGEFNTDTASFKVLNNLSSS